MRSDDLLFRVPANQPLVCLVDGATVALFCHSGVGATVAVLPCLEGGVGRSAREREH
eukprot:COSAG06_NODE_5798_length_3268_cov_1.731777_1_plen_57_part_00